MLKQWSEMWQRLSWRLSPHQLIEKFQVRTFDRRHGTDTHDFVHLSAMSIDSANRRLGEHYQPSPVHSLRRLLRRLGIHYPDFNFIDFGSGKGRALLVAGELPFKQVIGVEFGAELHRQALANVARYLHRQAQTVVSVHADATTFELPDSDLLLYFFNPFGAPVLQQVLANVVAALQQTSRRVLMVFLYMPPSGLECLAGFPQIRLRRRWGPYRVYECSSQPGTGVPSGRR